MESIPAGDDVRASPDLFQTLVAYLSEARERERGGVVLGKREDWGMQIVAVVFPPQLANAHDHCAFDVNSIDVVRKAVSTLTEGEAQQPLVKIVGWIHSHPYHGVFLSRTDEDTLASWAILDERTIAVVVDPFVRDRRKRIGWWYKDGRGRELIIDSSLDAGIETEQAAALVKSIRADDAHSRVWEVLTAEGVIRVFPKWAEPALSPEDRSPRRSL